MAFSAIVVAAGSGSRAGGDKQWRAVGGRPMVRWSVEALLTAGADSVVVVVASGAEPRAANEQGLTAADFAQRGGRDQMAAELREAMARAAARAAKQDPKQDAK